MQILRPVVRAIIAILSLTPSLTPVSADVQTGVQLVTVASNKLVSKLFQALAPGRENLVFAPFGLMSNVAMMLEGADGITAQEILKALGIPAKSRDDLRLGFKAYFDSFEASAENEEAAGSFNMAMLRSSQDLSSSYKALLTKYYRANITQVPYFDPHETSKLLEFRSDSGVMSHWKDYHRLAAFAFLSHVASAPFHRSSTETVPVPMIPQVGVFRSGRVGHLNCDAVQLPLEVGSVNLLLLVPDSSDSLDELLVKLSGESLQELVLRLRAGEAEISLPQFTILTSDLELTPFLRQLGMRSVFNATGANLHRAAASKEDDTPVYVKSVTQDAYFSTSFVAVNSVGSVSSNVLPRRQRRESSRIIVDRPFLFFLLHRDTQLVLLAGKVQNPTQVP